ncbi:hypothetical protein LMOSLCC2482_1653 [Listeria monocytogenes serotype 7 str. SLCC2482]|nr:hypothetical protein LMOh7858_1703 [Listeria monocytogenes str. 4b H7858] [Listeria monocytogenes serotype 4b str. H7858]CBY04174.1 hypothetical protein LMOSLCC2482_1653 [Listeria monocytogenes serotype 7 str. SLCC2482]
MNKNVKTGISIFIIGILFFYENSSWKVLEL